MMENKLFGFNRRDFILLVNLLQMNVRDRYLGSALGCLWAIANPLFMLCLYTYVFGFIFKIKLPGAETTLAYVVWLISGYGPWIAMQESLMSSTNSVVGASGMVKNMAFKTELLPLAGALVGLINLAVSLIFLLLLIIGSGMPITWHFLFLPFIVIVQFAFAVSLGIWLAAIAVFIRDIIQIMPTALTVIMFITPIFYAYESMPSIIQKVSVSNPFYQISEGYRAILISNSLPNFYGQGYVLFISIVIFYFGLRAFRRAKGHFDSAI